MVVTDATLSDGSGSDVVELMVAVFVALPGLFSLSVIVAVAVPLLTIVPMLNATTPLVRLVLPSVVVAETNVAPAGNGLVMTTPVALDGP